MDYKFAVGWYEGAGGEYIQAKLAPGRVDVSDYNSMRVIDPSDKDQSTVFPLGLTERLFDGSFNDNKINDIDGRGWRFGQDVPNNQITASQDANFSVLTAFPEEALDPANDDFLLWEQGGNGIGSFLGFKDGFLRLRAGAGGTSIPAPGSLSSVWLFWIFRMRPLLRIYDGKIHDLRWEMKIGGGGLPGRVAYG